MHEDGFADACDGLGGGTTREQVLAIMKDSRIGAYGAIGVVMMLGLKWATLDAIPAGAFAVLVIGAHMFSRWCAGGLIWRLRYARSDAQAKAAPFAGRLSAGDWLLSGALGAAGLAPVALAGVSAHGALVARALASGAAAAAVIAVMAGAYFRRRIGGYTGDCLGAVQQVSELAFLAAGLAASSPQQ